MCPARLIYDNSGDGRLGGWGSSMQEFIARENIKRFKAQLQACTDDRQRQTLSRLLEAEETRLAELRNATGRYERGPK